ncbi:MAG: AAA family ATPase, partial [Bacteroidales bacterium]|nr:AAA family ATPase [Bacteroidales bacterium]
QRQRALIAKAIAQQTPIMILDEPTAFLDYKSRIELMRLLRDLAHSGKSILITTHDLYLVKKYADWIWAIEDGKITEGTIKDCEAFLP